MAISVTFVQSAALDVHDTLAAIWCLFLPMLINIIQGIFGCPKAQNYFLSPFLVYIIDSFPNDLSKLYVPNDEVLSKLMV